MSAEHSLEPGIYLEIGVGGNDFPPNPTMLVDTYGQPGPRRFVDGAHYIGIDRPRAADRYWLAMHAWMTGDNMEAHDWNGTVPQVAGGLALAAATAAAKRPGEAVDFMLADAHALPFPDQSIREVYACDVLSSQLNPDSIAHILGEARRVLRPDGRLVTRECFTPHWFDEAALRPAAAVAHLAVTQMAYHPSPAYGDLAEEFGNTYFDTDAHAAQHGFMYFGILTPTE